MENTSQIFVSVVMPVYNSACYVADAISSILNQSHSHFELIIINDASTDDTAKEIKAFTDPRLICVENPENMGNAWSRNLGASLAKGKYILVHDSDDISLPERFSKQVQYMEDHPEIAVLGSFIKVYRENLSYIKSYPTDPAYVCAGLFFRNTIAQPTVIIRKEITDRYNLRHLRYYEDFNLWYQVSEYSLLANLPEPLVHYRYFENDNKTRHRQIKEHSTHLLSLHKLHELQIFPGEYTEELYAGFLRQAFPLSLNEYNELFKLFNHIRRQNSRLKKYPDAYFKSCMIFEHLRLWLFFWRKYPILALLKLLLLKLKILSMGIKPFYLFWQNAGKYYFRKNYKY